MKRGWEPVYVDLWENKQETPAFLIEQVLVAALRRYEPQLKRAFKAVGISHFSVQA